MAEVGFRGECEGWYRLEAVSWRVVGVNSRLLSRSLEAGHHGYAQRDGAHLINRLCYKNFKPLNSLELLTRGLLCVYTNRRFLTPHYLFFALLAHTPFILNPRRTQRKQPPKIRRPIPSHWIPPARSRSQHCLKRRGIGSSTQCLKGENSIFQSMRWVESNHPVGIPMGK